MMELLCLHKQLILGLEYDLAIERRQLGKKSFSYLVWEVEECVEVENRNSLSCTGSWHILYYTEHQKKQIFYPNRMHSALELNFVWIVEIVHVFSQPKIWIVQKFRNKTFSLQYLEVAIKFCCIYFMHVYIQSIHILPYKWEIIFWSLFSLNIWSFFMLFHNSTSFFMAAQ
jgi:hypothetical protein